MSARSGGRAVRLLRRLCLLSALAVAAGLLVMVVLRWLPVPISAFMAARHMQRLLTDSGAAPIHYQWVELERISPQVALAVIAAEDQRFPEHWGFDFLAIKGAVEYNRRSEKVRGASTISQQTAKNLFLWSGRSYVRKGLETVLTLWLELLWPKKRILEVYLNIAEFGDGIYGVQAASREFFATTPDRLNRREAALLAAVLPSPRRLHADRPSLWLLRRADRISLQMDRLGGLRFLERLNPPPPLAPAQAIHPRVIPVSTR